MTRKRPGGLLTDDDVWLFNEGAHTRLYERLGAQLDAAGTHLGLWAPNAAAVSVIGDFNGWRPGHDLLEPRGSSGLWQGRVSGLEHASRYKFHIDSHRRGYAVDKADPFAFYAEPAPRTASVVWDLGHEWGDADWMATRAAHNALDAPITIYEMHLGSWRRDPASGDRSLNYRELAEPLARYVQRHRLHPRRADAGDGAPLLRLVGLPDHRATSRPRRASARRRTSCTWSTCCTSTGSA